jgi:uncharacterized protein (DUF2147 family)
MIAAALLLPLTVAGSESQPGDIFGLWVSEDGRGAVQIAPCGGGAVCGHIIWLRDKTRLDGGPLVDVFNPDPSQRSRPICGLQVIGGAKHQADGSWDEGWIYDPKAGKTYDVALSLQDANTLAVRGYVETQVLGRTLYWTRAHGGLPKCR